LSKHSTRIRIFKLKIEFSKVCFDILFTETKLKVDDLGSLERFLQPVSPYWVSIADQLGMTLHHVYVYKRM